MLGKALMPGCPWSQQACPDCGERPHARAQDRPVSALSARKDATLRSTERGRQVSVSAQPVFRAPSKAGGSGATCLQLPGQQSEGRCWADGACALALLCPAFRGHLRGNERDDNIHTLKSVCQIRGGSALLGMCCLHMGGGGGLSTSGSGGGMGKVMQGICASSDQIGAV